MNNVIFVKLKQLFNDFNKGLVGLFRIFDHVLVPTTDKLIST